MVSGALRARRALLLPGTLLTGANEHLIEETKQVAETADQQEPTAPEPATQPEERTQVATTEPEAADQQPAADTSHQANGTAGERADESDEQPMTMAELLDNPENEVKSPKHGDVVEGVVVRIDPDEILVDFGGKSEGVVSNRELSSRRSRDAEESRPELSIGDDVLVYVLQPVSPEGHGVHSRRRAGL
jgi:biotin carboxyl carrier protein